MPISQQKIAKTSYQTATPVLDDSRRKKYVKESEIAWELTYTHCSHAESETRTSEQTQ